MSNRLLYLFALADTRGRTTAETTRPEENLHLFRLAAEESGCFDRPYPFANDHARFLFHRQGRPSLHYVPHEDYRCTVTMLSGLPARREGLAGSPPTGPACPSCRSTTCGASCEVEATDDQGGVIQAGRERCREHLRAGAVVRLQRHQPAAADPPAVDRPVRRLRGPDRGRLRRAAASRDPVAATPAARPRSPSG